MTRRQIKQLDGGGIEISQTDDSGNTYSLELIPLQNETMRLAANADGTVDITTVQSDGT